MSVSPRPEDISPAESRRELVRSEERLLVSTVRVPARRVRLEKYVVTETRTITIQVSHEEVRLVDINIAGTSAGSDDTSDPAINDIGADAGRWLTLSEERVAITTETVPVERVRLAVASVVEHRDVTEEVRREQLMWDTDPTLNPGIAPTTAKDTA